MLSSTEVSASRVSRIQPMVLVLLVVVAAAAVMLGTQRGPGATPDSATYASVAENLAGGGGLTTYDGSELTLFPPGLSGLLAVGGAFGLEPAAAARVVNVLSLVAIVLLTATVLRRAVTSVPLRLVGVGLVALSPVLLGISVMLWSEAPFIAVTLAFLVLLDRALVERRADLVAAAAVFAGAGFLLRYSGLALIGFGTLALAWQAFRLRAQGGSERLALYVGIALVPVVGWLFHNQAHAALLSAASGSPIEDRARTGQGLVDNAQQVLETIGSWLTPRGGLVILLVVVTVGIGVVLARRDDTEAVGERRGVALAGGFAVFYLVLLVVGASITYVDPIDDRLLAPVYVPLLVVLAVIVERALELTGDRPHLRRGLAMVLVAWLILPAAAWLGRIGTASQGVGFASAQWQESELIGLLNRSKDGLPVYSNWPDAGYYAAGLQPVHFGPAASSAGRVEFAAAVHCTGPVRFAQFIYLRPMLFGPEDFGPSLEVELIDTVADGSLYEVSSSGDPADVVCAESP